MRALTQLPAKTAPTADWIPVIRDRIVAGWHPSRIILFGSHARGEARPDSDIDLLVVLAGEADRQATASAIHVALADLPVSKDIVVTTPEEIERRGRVVGTVLYAALRGGQAIHDMSDSVRLEDVRRWLRCADEDLSISEWLLSQPGHHRNAALHAQQAAEKALKAALIFLNTDPPRTHDMNALWELLSVEWGERPAPEPELKQLGKLAVEARCPGDWPEPTPSDARVALERAKLVLDRIHTVLARRGIHPATKLPGD